MDYSARNYGQIAASSEVVYPLINRQMSADTLLYCRSPNVFVDMAINGALIRRGMMQTSIEARQQTVRSQKVVAPSFLASII